MTIAIDRRIFLGSATALAGFASAPVWAKVRQPGARAISAAWPTIQNSLDKWVREKYVPGTGGAIARGTDQADFLVSGTIAKESAIAVTPDTLWRAYSMTKPVTGMAAMLLIEAGKLKLNQNIADLLPEWANPMVAYEPEKSLKARPAQSPVTVRGLLTHTAGLGYNIVTKGALLKSYLQLGLTPGALSRKPLPGFETVAPTAPSLREFSERLASLPLIADPGAKWSYSVSLDLLGRVIEVASGMSFEAFVQARLFGPLGMTSTYWQVPESEKARLTTNYAATPIGTFAVDAGNDSIYLDKPAFAFGGAGLVTTMRDYDRFLAMLMGEGALGQTRIMSPETARLAMSNLVHPDTKMESLVKGQGFGAGGRVTLKSGPNGEGVGSFGWGGAASTIGWVDRARNLRASGWTQILAQPQAFVEDFGKSVYASL
jgi:CubicO group peptidase (beta-lactamase class C family)